VGITQGEVSKSIPNGEIAEQNKPRAEHNDGEDEEGNPRFAIPLYNVTA
jgi:hypothetical protein